MLCTRWDCHGSHKLRYLVTSHPHSGRRESEITACAQFLLSSSFSLQPRTRDVAAEMLSGNTLKDTQTPRSIAMEVLGPRKQ